MSCDVYGAARRRGTTGRCLVDSRTVPSASAPNPVFRRLWRDAVPALVAGTHRRDAPPVDGGRWPVSVIARPPAHVRDDLEAIMVQALPYAGPGHFHTGRQDCLHITIRALEPFRAAARADDPIVGEWERAMRATAATTQPFDLTFTGITLTTGGILAQLEPHDERPWELLDRFRSELGPLAWFEDQWTRDIWYCSLLHFPTDIVDPIGLIDWATALRECPPIRFEVTALELVRFHHCRVDAREHSMRPQTWLSVPLLASC